MTGMEMSPNKYILELAGSASPDLNVAFNEFVRLPEANQSSPQNLGRQAMFNINLLSFQSSEYTPPAQKDRDQYGEGSGVALGVYMRGLDDISRNKLEISSEADKSGVEDDGTVWVTLAPSDTELEKIVKVPLFDRTIDPEEADLRMRLVIPERYRLGVADAKMALNGLRAKIAADAARRGKPMPVDPMYPERQRAYRRELFATRPRVQKTKVPRHPTPESATGNDHQLPKAA